MTSQPPLMSVAAPKWAPTDRQPVRAPTGATWADFAAWVTWLDDAYELSLPTCWMRHEGVVHALSALWDAWLAVYSKPLPKGQAPPDTARAAWHVQFRRPIIAELLDDKSPLEQCKRADHHTAYRPRANQPRRLADALNQLATHAIDSGADVLRGPEETTRFEDLAGVDRPAAVLAVLYHQPNGA